MDPIAVATLNTLLGNDRTSAALEIALTGGMFSFDTANTFAIGGAEAVARLGNEGVEPYRVYRAGAGVVIDIAKISSGRFLYFAIGGGVCVDEALGSRSTYLPGGFGGLEGRRLKTGDKLKTGRGASARKHIVTDSLPRDFRPPGGNQDIRFVARIADEAGEIAGDYTLSAASDRTGYRLEGSTRSGGSSVTSEPVCPGVIQLPPGGEPIILMADAPTIGGYRVMGGVIAADLGALAQRLPGESVRLMPITIERARREIEKRAETETLIDEWCLT